MIINTDQKDIEFTRRAIELSRKGIGLVSPNPLVGCVIVDLEGNVVGEGAYVYDDVIHAEAIALRTAGERARGGTAYVSLEPHSHFGRTEPCTDALIAAGVTRVVAPIEDPNPKVSGKGFETLRNAGVEVTVGIMADEARRVNEKFICWHDRGRPFVHLKLAMSLDGRISLGPGVSTALTGAEAHERVQTLRHEHDAILIGSTTATVDDPKLTDRSGRPRRRPLLRVILDGRLRLGPESLLATTAEASPTVVFTDSKDSHKIKELERLKVEIVVPENGVRDLESVLSELKRREIQSVLVEGGAEVAGAFVDARLVDKITFFLSSIVVGGRLAPTAVGGRGAGSLSEAVKLRNKKVEMAGNDIEITGYPEFL